jgi:hypothetical protein
VQKNRKTKIKKRNKLIKKGPIRRNKEIKMFQTIMLSKNKYRKLLGAHMTKSSFKKRRQSKIKVTG